MLSFPSVWRNQLDNNGISDYVARFSEMTKLNKKVLDTLAQLSAPADLKEEVKWLERSYGLGYDYSRLFLDYCRIYRSALTALRTAKPHDQLLSGI